MAENNTITEIKIGGKLVPFIQDEDTNNGRFFIVDSNDISFGNGVKSVTEMVNTINTDLDNAIKKVSTDLTQDIADNYKELSDKIDDINNAINNRLTSIENRLSILEMAVSGDTTKVELELRNPPTSTKGEYTVIAKEHVYNGDSVKSYKWYINGEPQAFESNEFTKSYDNNTRDNLKYDIKCEITTNNGITVVSDTLKVTVPGITLKTISITPKSPSITESTGSIKLNVSNFIATNYSGTKDFECKWEITGNTENNKIFIADGNTGTVESWSSVKKDGTSEITIQSGLVSDKTQESITIKMTPQIDKTGINTENTNIGEPINITIKVGKNEVINYYWYIGQTSPASIGEIANSTTDKWTELGTSLSGITKIQAESPASKYGYWFVVIPSSLGFKPFNSDGSTDESGGWTSSASTISGYTVWSKNDKTTKINQQFHK